MGRVGAAAPESYPPTPAVTGVLTVAPPGHAQSEVCRMKINKIDTVANNKKHVGLLLLVFVKFFLFLLPS